MVPDSAGSRVFLLEEQEVRMKAVPGEIAFRWSSEADSAPVRAGIFLMFGEEMVEDVTLDSPHFRAKDDFAGS